VISASYSGSTLVSILLGRAPGVLFTSEVLQILKSGPKIIGCKACGPNCRFWTPEFLDRCREDRQRYNQIARRAREQLGSSHVVFKEMAWSLYEQNLREGNQFDRFLLLMKCPQAYAYSCHVHQDLPVSAALDKYSREYRGALDFATRTGIPTTVVHFDAFSEAPEPELRRVCGHLGIDFSPTLLDLGWTEWMHPLATGNAGAFSHLDPKAEFEREVSADPYWQRVYKDRHIAWIREHHGMIVPDRKWEAGLTTEQLAEVARHEGAQGVFASLCRLASGGPLVA
jgi:hypothetical protein